MTLKGHITFNTLYLINSALYDQSLYETHNSKSYMAFQKTLKGQIKLLELFKLAGCFS